MLSRIDALVDGRLGHRPAISKLVKYGSASAVGVVTSQATLVFCLVVLELPAVLSNLISVTLGTIPNYMINRAWTFNKRGTHSFTREVLPFWLMALLGLVLSTFAVAWADDVFDGNVLALSAASVGSFGVLWIAKFFVLDRVLFAPIAAAVEAETG